MKPMRPFPLPLNIGTDICRISRIYGILNGPRAARFVDRILAPEEQVRNEPRLQVLSRVRSETNRPVHHRHHDETELRDPELWKCAAFVAGRFAAKEAAIKAHPHRRLTFHDVVIERRGVVGERLGSGPPVARIKSGREGDADESAMISISHDGDYATAICLGYDPGCTSTTTEA